VEAAQLPPWYQFGTKVMSCRVSVVSCRISAVSWQSKRVGIIPLVETACVSVDGVGRLLGFSNPYAAL
jgi:hypothetical protein